VADVTSLVQNYHKRRQCWIRLKHLHWVLTIYRAQPTLRQLEANSIASSFKSAICQTLLQHQHWKRPA